MSEKWKYELSEAYIIIMALKVVFVVVFEVNDDTNEQNVLKTFYISACCDHPGWGTKSYYF